MNGRVGTRLATVVGLTISALFLAVVLLGEIKEVRAGDDGKEIQAALDKIAAAIKSGDKATAKSVAEAMAKKYDIDDVMETFKPRKKKGRGVGKTPGAIVPDGIELKLITMGRDAPTAAQMSKEAEALEEMAYIVAAVAEFTSVKSPAAAKGKKDWGGWSQDSKVAAIQLAEAVKSKGAQEVKTAASKLNIACNSCHSAYK